MEVGNVLQLPDRKGCTRGDAFGNVQFPLDMEQVTGIEPASPAWKAGALAVVLHPQAH